jgi:hypothetical protein
MTAILSIFQPIIITVLDVTYGDSTAKDILDTERLFLQSPHFATRSPLAAASQNTFPRQLQTNFKSFPTIVVYRVILGSLVT